jgi:hypothetical protein
VNTPWVLVVTCPHYVRGQVPLELQGVAGQPPIEVLASVYGVSHKTVPIGCFPPPRGNAQAASKVVATGQDVNLSLPVLEPVTTAETLTSVSLSGDRIDSMFPPGQITSNDEIIWQGTSGLSPSLSATNLSSAENSSKAGFLAGLLYGLAAGLFIPFLQDVSQAVKATSSPREAAREEAATGR